MCSVSLKAFQVLSFGMNLSKPSVKSACLVSSLPDAFVRSEKHNYVKPKPRFGEEPKVREDGKVEIDQETLLDLLPKMATLSKNKLERTVPFPWWPDNTQVFASVLQNSPDISFVYLRFLLTKLDEVNSLQEAHQHYEDNGLSFVDKEGIISFLLPTSSIERVDGWDKSNRRTALFNKVLIVQCKPNPGPQCEAEDAMFSEMATLTRDAFMRNFKIPENNVDILENPTVEAIEEKFGELHQFTHSAFEPEICIVLIGHGSKLDYEPGVRTEEDKKKEGSGVGVLTLDPEHLSPSTILPEPHLKQLIAQYLYQAKNVTVLAPFCHSGAWVA
jgi:hypothetical protein